MQRKPDISIVCVCAVSAKPCQLQVDKKIHLNRTFRCIFLMIALEKPKHKSGIFS